MNFITIAFDSEFNCWIASFGLANNDFATLAEANNWIRQMAVEYNAADYI